MGPSHNSTGRLLAAAALSALLLATAPAGAASGRGSSSLKVSENPQHVRVRAPFTVTATGSTRRAALWLFLDFNRCARTQSAELARGAPPQSQRVTGTFTVGPLTASASHSGTDHICAYLVNARGRTIKRAMAVFHVG